MIRRLVLSVALVLVLAALGWLAYATLLLTGFFIAGGGARMATDRSQETTCELPPVPSDSYSRCSSC